MENLTFAKAFIRYADVRVGETGAFVRLHLTSEYTEGVQEQIGWDEPGDSRKKSDMIGELSSGTFILTPDSEMLQKHEMQFPFHSASDFKVITVEQDESKRREIRFVVRTDAKEAATMVFAYCDALAKQTGSLKLSYSSQDGLDLG